MWTDDELKSRINKTVQWLRTKVAEANAKGVVVGISGGVDSAVTAGLCARAFPDNCILVMVPSHSDPDDIEDAYWVAEGFDLRPLEVNLSNAYSQVFDQVKKGLEYEGYDQIGEKISKVSLQARLRMATLFTVADALNYLVVGTDNAPEIYTGNFTKYGDSAVDLWPISSLTKTEVRAWARILGFPLAISTRVSAADETDAAEMGLTFDQVDHFLSGEEVSSEVSERLEALHHQSEHKRNLPLSLELPKLKGLK